MIAVIATLTAIPERADELVEVFTTLAEQVNRLEPGNHLYQLIRSRSDPASFRVIELYDDEDALSSHGRSDHFRAAGALLAPLLGAAPAVETFDVP